MQDTGFSSSLERCGGCSPPLLRRLADSLQPDSLTPYPESGNRDLGLGIKEQDTGFGYPSLERCGGCGGYFRSSAAARVWCVYINSKRSKKTAPAAPAEEAGQFFSQTHIYILHTIEKNSTPTGGVSGLPLLFPLAEDLSQTIEKIFLSSTGIICQ